MKRTGQTKRTKKNNSHFACPIEGHTELGLAMLIVEDDSGAYKPVGVVATLNEAREIAEDDLRRRMRELERGGSPMPPAIYKLFARGIDGDYQEAGRFSF